MRFERNYQLTSEASNTDYLAYVTRFKNLFLLHPEHLGEDGPVLVSLLVDWRRRVSRLVDGCRDLPADVLQLGGGARPSCLQRTWRHSTGWPIPTAYWKTMNEWRTFKKTKPQNNNDQKFWSISPRKVYNKPQIQATTRTTAIPSRLPGIQTHDLLTFIFFSGHCLVRLILLLHLDSTQGAGPSRG